jgi:hypothetical protein
MTSSAPDVPPLTDSTSLEASTPSSSDQPAEASVQMQPAFGWTFYAEQINGRFAMVGFLLLLLLNWFTGQDVFTWLGLR